MKLVDALFCPYCEGPLLKESYYFRCVAGHRFRSSLESLEGRIPPAHEQGGIPPADAQGGILRADQQGGTSTVDEQAGILPADQQGRTPPADEQTTPQQAARPALPDHLVLSVIDHPNKRELGRRHAFPLTEG
jgi:hypothetical protein